MNKVQTQFAFTDNGAKAVIVDGDEFDFTVIGDLGGGAVYIEETTITWRQSGLADEATWEADTSIPDMWSAVEWEDRNSTRLNSSHIQKSRMPSSA